MLEYFFFVCLGAVLALYLIGLPVDVSLLQGCFREINRVLCDVVFGSFKKGVIHLIQSLFVSFLNLLNEIPFSLFTAVANSIFSHLLKRFLKELRQLNHIFVFMYQTTSFINELISRETWEKNWSSTRAFLNDTSAYLVERFDGIKAIAYNIDYVFENYLLIPLNNNITLFIEDIVNELTGVRASTFPETYEEARNKLISIVLLMLWMLAGVILISKLSYTKFFILMSSSFLLHAIFGPLWCINKLIYLIGLTTWGITCIASTPVLAAIMISFIFGCSYFIGAWGKVRARIRSFKKGINNYDTITYNDITLSLEGRLEKLESLSEKILESLEKIGKKLEEQC